MKYLLGALLGMFILFIAMETIPMDNRWNQQGQKKAINIINTNPALLTSFTKYPNGTVSLTYDVGGQDIIINMRNLSSIKYLQKDLNSLKIK